MDIKEYYANIFPSELTKYSEHSLERLRIKDFLGEREITILRIKSGMIGNGSNVRYQPKQKVFFIISLYFISLTDAAIYTYLKTIIKAS